MRFACRMSRSGEDRWDARHEGTDLGLVTATGRSRDEALEKLRQELRYRLELCPCTGESYQHIQIEIVED